MAERMLGSARRGLWPQCDVLMLAVSFAPLSLGMVNVRSDRYGTGLTTGVLRLAPLRFSDSRYVFF
jgi:hypothetical protein